MPLFFQEYMKMKGPFGREEVGTAKEAILMTSVEQRKHLGS